MKKTQVISLICLSFLFCISCKNSKDNTRNMPGSDKDKHGCTGSAGYTWSEVKNDCIRIFESGVRLNNNSNFACYAVFSSDSSLVELFIPERNDHPVLRKDGQIWRDKKFELIKNESAKFELKENNKLIYSE